MFGLACWLAGLGIASLASNNFEDYVVPSLACLAIATTILLVYARRVHNVLDPTLVVLLGLCLIGVTICGGLPAYFGVFPPSSIVHRSVISAAVLLVLAVPACCSSVFYLRGATPAAEDAARYPLLLTLVGLSFGLYAVLALNLTRGAIQQFQAKESPGWRLFVQPFSTAFDTANRPELLTRPDLLNQPGLLNQLLGTALIVLVTLAIAAPVGIGTGIFVAELNRGAVGRAVSFSTTALRGISAFLLAMAATNIVTATLGTPLAAFFAGSHTVGAATRFDNGSFLTAGLLTALLAIPTIARATQEGCRSLPRGMREGSAALGATVDYTLLRITLPWALPNILTGLLLAAAEAAGGLAVIILIAGTGQYGVGLFSEVSTLSSAIFGSLYSTDKQFRDLNASYEYVTGLTLLALALALTVMALLMKHRFAARARGA
jgi:ABC-type phosphate transport system permease subunit